MSLIVLVVIIPLALGCVYCLRSYLLTFIIALCNTHTEIALDKSYHRNEVRREQPALSLHRFSTFCTSHSPQLRDIFLPSNS